MRVLIIGNFLSATRGTRHYCEDLALQLRRGGHEVVTASHYEGRVRRLAHMIWTILVGRRKYDVATVDIFSGLALFWGYLASISLRIARRPHVFVLRGGKLAEGRSKRPAMLGRILRSASLLVTPSRFLIKELEPFVGPIRYIPNAIDFPRYQPRPQSESSHRLVWIRAFLAHYQPDMAIRAMAHLRESVPDLRLTMIGPDKGDGTLERCRAMVSSMGLDHQVVFVGPVPKSAVPELLRGADIFWNTTRYESFGVAVMEAAACGLAIVSTNVGELSFLWTDGENALLVDADDPIALADRIRQVVSEPALAARLRESARRRSRDFDWPTVLEKWERLFEDLVVSRRRSH